MSEVQKPVRTVDTVTAEIQYIQAQARKVFYEAVVQIGTRLLEVKEMVPHGEWTDYLENRLGYKPSTAQNYMRVAKEFGSGQVALDGTDPQTLFGKLGYAQLLPLLALPDEQRRELAQEVDLPALSSREIEELVQARKTAEARAEQAEHKLQKVQKSQKAAQEREANALAAQRVAEQRADKLAEEHQFLQNQLDSLREQAEQTTIQAEVVPDEAALEAVRQEVREQMQQTLEQAEIRAAQAESKLAKAKNPLAMKVNLLFEETQNVTRRMEEALAALAAQQPETADKFRQAIAMFLTQKGEQMT